MIASMHPRCRMIGFLEFAVDRDSGKLQPPKLQCPIGHIIPWEYAFHEAGYPRCRHCNARLYVQFFGRTSKHEPPLMFVVEVTFPELQRIQTERLDVYQILAYLGLEWAPKPPPIASQSGVST